VPSCLKVSKLGKLGNSSIMCATTRRFVIQVCEAEAMVAGGVMDVFVSNEVVDPRKITRLVALAAQGEQSSFT
jgi:D-serine deaminase-like pyridoxal phosphate-dependent protein